ncbi:hypothetical protein [Halorubrum vacuolatum]|uniref:Ba3-type terminal oxidase subunit CbaD n=1 Tax=Halorubrum vacuolatum TaxID=63740 RepID=A0A238UVM7_HALVU|nr:hypothetical protein [Halorubrum vacuolatum]SNR26275.1 hypothetical protein SAMN06264855_101466 [Halorubrum vacuolatum]
MAGSDTASTVTGEVNPPGDGEPIHEDAETEEFDPIGTLALIMTYFAILVIAWVYVYFIEFLSRDLTVIG